MQQVNCDFCKAQDIKNSRYIFVTMGSAKVKLDMCSTCCQERNLDRFGHSESEDLVESIEDIIKAMVETAVSDHLYLAQ